jgi:FkbM family methyltransferase
MPLGRIGRRTQPVERLDLRILSELLRENTESGLFLEIGANDGGDTRRLLDAFPGIRIECFEPDPRAIALWRTAVTSSRARLHEIAIGSKNGTTLFHASSGSPAGRETEFPEGWHLSGSIRRPTGHLSAHPWCEFTSTIEVAVRSLDSWAAAEGVTEVDFIWADVQGAEIDLIEGGQATLSQTKFLYTEYCDVELYEGQHTLERLLELMPGWAVHTRFSDDVLLENRRFSRD